LAEYAMERLTASRAEILQALDRHRAASAASEERSGLLSRRHGSKFPTRKSGAGAQEEVGAVSADVDLPDVDTLDDDPPDDDEAETKSAGVGGAGRARDGGLPGYDTGAGARRLVPLTLNRRNFYPRDWRTNDGFCPAVSRHNPKLGHVKNCSTAARREPHGNELVAEISINVGQEREL